MNEHSYEKDGLTWTVEQLADQAIIYWKGIADSRFPGSFLGPLTEEWTQRLSSTEVTVDLRQLEYMNSAAVAPLIKLVRALDANGQRIRVVFLDVEWQRTHGNCMRAIARTLKNVSVIRESPTGEGNALDPV